MPYRDRPGLSSGVLPCVREKRRHTNKSFCGKGDRCGLQVELGTINPGAGNLGRSHPGCCGTSRTIPWVGGRQGGGGQFKSRRRAQEGVCVMRVGRREKQRVWTGGSLAKQAVNAPGLHSLSQDRGQQSTGHARGQVRPSLLPGFVRSTN